MSGVSIPLSAARIFSPNKCLSTAWPVIAWREQGGGGVRGRGRGGEGREDQEGERERKRKRGREEEEGDGEEGEE